MLSLVSHVQLFVTQWTVTRQAPLSMGILQAQILKWVATSYSRGSSLLRDQTHISCNGRQVPSGKPWEYSSLNFLTRAAQSPVQLLGVFSALTCDLCPLSEHSLDCKASVDHAQLELICECLDKLKANSWHAVIQR